VGINCIIETWELLLKNSLLAQETHAGSDKRNKVKDATQNCWRLPLLGGRFISACANLNRVVVLTTLPSFLSSIIEGSDATGVPIGSTSA
jgi:hypothetical protein